MHGDHAAYVRGNLETHFEALALSMWSLYIYIVGFILVSEPVFFLSWHEHCSCHHHGLPPPVQRRSGVHLRKRGEFYVDNCPAVC